MIILNEFQRLTEDRKKHIIDSFNNGEEIVKGKKIEEKKVEKGEDEEKEEKLQGGKGDNKGWQDIADKHGVDLDKIMKQVAIGLKVEKEHTSEEKEAEEIVKDHLMEDPKYYTSKKDKNWGKKEAENTEKEEKNEEVEKSNKSDIEKAFDVLEKPMFEKGGEGSKGGHIIGHTKSGKPIYDHANHPSHEHFTSEDHEDAASIYEKESNHREKENSPKNEKLGHLRKKELDDKFAKHEAMAGGAKFTPEKSDKEKAGPEIGKTKSGKPLHKNSKYADHGFTREDRKDAIKFHEKKAKKAEREDRIQDKIGHMMMVEHHIKKINEEK